MRIKDIFTKIGKVLPYAGLALGLQNFSMAKESRMARLQAASDAHRNLLLELKKKEDLIVENLNTQNKIASLSADISDQLETVSHNSRMITEYTEKLKDADLDSKEREFITSTVDQNVSQKTESIEKANSALKNIMDSLFSDNYNFQLNNIIESYKEFLNTLTVEQHSPILNILGLIIIFSCIISIIIIIYSEYLIRYFNIETRYPKISKFIQIRRTLQQYYLSINLIIILITIFLLF
jgi:hypothetical protein